MADPSTPKAPPTVAKKIGGLSAAVIAIIGAITAVEGGFTNNPRDPGGATNHGITEKVARANGYTGSMRDLSKDQATQIYASDYIAKPGFDRIIAISPPVGEELADSGVNAGTARAGKWFQSALNSLNRQHADYPDVPVDGQIGPASEAAYRGLVKVRGAKLACQLTIKLMDAQQGVYYMSIATTNPNFEGFMPGWVNARIGNVSLSRC